jgi:steroid delta-isomerase-like uncharacterized protein
VKRPSKEDAMDNARIVRGVAEQLFGRGRLDFVDEYYDPQYRGHDTLNGEFGRLRLKEIVAMYRTAFPNMNMRIDDLVETSEKVLARWTARGTHTGMFLGVPPTGRESQVQGISLYTFQDGLILEEWTQWNALGLLRDLGITPELPEPSRASVH